jgi:hypothetical protein
MSFILDALKKAERDRSRVPTLATVHGPAREAARAIGLWVAAGVLLAGGGLLLWLVWPSPDAPPPAATDFQSRVSAPVPASKASPERKIASAEPGGSPSSSSGAGIPQNPDIGPAREDPRQQGQASVVNPRSIPSRRSSLSVPAGVPDGADTGTASERRRIENKPIEARRAEPPPIERKAATPRPAESVPPPQGGPNPGADRAHADVVAPPPSSLPAKPPTLREAMAKMTLDVFVYTGVKADRMVVINGRRYVEGQYIDELYLLEDITPEGPVLSYQGEHAILRP